MSIDFSTLQGLSIPEGEVVKIEDAAGNVLWAVPVAGAPIVLEVEKITSDTYAAETTYTGEQFILLDIYPKSANSTVKVTYGGLTKTLTFSGTNAQQVFFGTFNGVTDEVETPASGMLTIEGDCVGVGVGTYNDAKASSEYCSCVTAISEWGEMTDIPSEAFYNCYNLNVDAIPEGVTEISSFAFYMGSSSAKMYNGKITLPSTLQSLCGTAFAKENTVDEGYYDGYLRDLILLSTTPPALMGMENVTLAGNGVSIDYPLILVPKGCVEAYKTAEGWSDYAEHIFEVGHILFGISTYYCLAIDGMTWAEWIESEYNNGLFTINVDNYILYKATSDSTWKRVLDVTPTDIIISRRAYSAEW